MFDFGFLAPSRFSLSGKNGSSTTNVSNARVLASNSAASSSTVVPRAAFSLSAECLPSSSTNRRVRAGIRNSAPQNPHRHRPTAGPIGADVRPTEKLACRLCGVDVAPQPFQSRVGLTHIAVVDSQSAAAAVLTRLRHVGAELTDDQAHPRDRKVVDPLSRLPGFRVVVGSEQRIDVPCGLRSYADALLLRGQTGGRSRGESAWRRSHAPGANTRSNGTASETPGALGPLPLSRRSWPPVRANGWAPDRSHPRARGPPSGPRRHKNAPLASAPSYDCLSAGDSTWRLVVTRASRPIGLRYSRRGHYRIEITGMTFKLGTVVPRGAPETPQLTAGVAARGVKGPGANDSRGSPPSAPSRALPWRPKQVALILVVLLSCTFAACGSGEGTPVGGPDKASCTSGYPPGNVRLPANTCGVSSLHIPSNTHNPNIPRDVNAGTIELDLYIEGDHTCGIGPALCAVDDNRPFVSPGSPDPHADPTRNRVHMVLDFASQSIRVQISPSCRIHPVDLPVAGPTGFNGKKECFAPNNIGQGTDLSLRSPSPGTVEVKLNVLQTAYYASPLKLGQIENTFDLTPHPDGSVDLSEQGTNFPDLAVIRDGVVRCADQATHITAAVLPAIGPNERDYHCRLPPTAPKSGNPKTTSTTTSTPTQTATGTTPSTPTPGSTSCTPTPCGSVNGVTVILTSVKRSPTNYSGEDLTPQGQFFVRMGVRVINNGAAPIAIDNLHFKLLDSSHVVDDTSDEGFGSRCGLTGNGDPGLTLANGADVQMPESLCFEPRGAVNSPFVVALGLDAGGEVDVPVR